MEIRFLNGFCLITPEGVTLFGVIFKGNLKSQITNLLSGIKHPSKLPEFLQRYFWDVKFDELSFDKHPTFIAERILNYGDPDAIRWLLSITDNQFIKTLVENSRNLNAKTRNYWQLMLM